MGWLKAPLQLAILSTIVLLAGCEESVFDCSTVTTIPTAECEALLAVHNTADGGEWTDDAGWLMSADPCGWSGVSCSDEQVVQVRLTSNKLDRINPGGTRKSDCPRFPRSQRKPVERPDPDRTWEPDQPQ